MGWEAEFVEESKFCMDVASLTLCYVAISFRGMDLSGLKINCYLRPHLEVSNPIKNPVVMCAVARNGKIEMYHRPKLCKAANRKWHLSCIFMPEVLPFQGTLSSLTVQYGKRGLPYEAEMGLFFFFDLNRLYKEGFF